VGRPQDKAAAGERTRARRIPSRVDAGRAGDTEKNAPARLRRATLTGRASRVVMRVLVQVARPVAGRSAVTVPRALAAARARPPRTT
jgi:hypothetical protein